VPLDLGIRGADQPECLNPEAHPQSMLHSK
jgi:hypothetical protein